MQKLDISIIFVIVIFIEAILLYRMYTNAKRHIQRSEDIRHTCDDLVNQMEALKSENISLKQQIGQLTEQNSKNSKDYLQQLKHTRHTCDDLVRQMEALKSENSSLIQKNSELNSVLKEMKLKDNVQVVINHDLCDKNKEYEYTIIKLELEKLKLEQVCRTSKQELEYWKNSSSDDIECSLRKIIYPELAKATSSHVHELEVKEKLREQILGYSKQFFLLNDSIMSPIESRIYYQIEIFLEKFSASSGMKYSVFPQVSMHSLIDVYHKYSDSIVNEIATTLDISETMVKNEIFYTYGNKSIDFLICLPYCAEKMYKNSYWYKYAPCLCIEIDGTSHDDSQQKFRDSVKDAVLRGLGIAYIRLEVENNELIPEDHYETLKNAISQALQLDCTLHSENP